MNPRGPLAYSPPQVDTIWGIWGSNYNIPRAIFYLLKGDYTLCKRSCLHLFQLDDVVGASEAEAAVTDFSDLPRYPSSTLFPVLFWGLLVQNEQ